MLDRPRDRRPRAHLHRPDRSRLAIQFAEEGGGSRLAAAHCQELSGGNRELAASRLPEFHRGVSTPTGQCPALWIKRHAMDCVLVPFQGAEPYHAQRQHRRRLSVDSLPLALDPLSHTFNCFDSAECLRELEYIGTCPRIQLRGGCFATATFVTGRRIFVPVREELADEFRVETSGLRQAE
jgi:hypothetical protein